MSLLAGFSPPARALIAAAAIAVVLLFVQAAESVFAPVLLANILIGSVLEPSVMGRGLGISALAVLLSLLLWSSALGTVGAFLSVPLTMALMIALEGSPQTRPISILLGPDVTKLPGPAPPASAEAASGDPKTPLKTGCPEAW